jgi:hypothetical protein
MDTNKARNNKKYAFDTKSSTNNVKGTIIQNLGE